MAIVSVKEIADGRGGDATVGLKSVRKHTRAFRVITNSAYDGSYEVLSASGIPRAGSLHPSDPRAYAKSAKAQQQKGKLVWTVTVEYTTERERSENPFADPAKIEWNTDTTQESFACDKNGDAILNSAGDPFEEIIKDDVSYWTVSITKNVPFVPLWINSYRDAVNSDAVFIDGVPIAAGMAKIKSIGISAIQTRGDYTYRELKLTIKIKGDWEKHILDNGLKALDPSDSTKRVHCKNNDGTFVTKPVCLDGSGLQLDNPTPSTAVFLTFDLRNTQPFFTLPLN